MIVWVLWKTKTWQTVTHWHLIAAPAASIQTLKLLSLTKQQLMCLRCSSTFSLKPAQFFCKPRLDTRCTKYKQSEPKHSRISPSGFGREGFWTLLTRHCGFCSSGVHSAYPMLKDSTLLQPQGITVHVFAQLDHLWQMTKYKAKYWNQSWDS